MVGRKRGDIPKSLVRGRDRFEAWRRWRKGNLLLSAVLDQRFVDECAVVV